MLLKKKKHLISKSFKKKKKFKLLKKIFVNKFIFKTWYMRKKFKRLRRRFNWRYKKISIIKFASHKKFKFFMRRKLYYRNLIDKLKKNIIYNLFVKITSVKNNLFVNVYLKYKKYKILFVTSLGLLKINTRKERRAPISKKLIAKSTRFFFKKFFLRLKRKKIKIAKLIYIFPRKTFPFLFYTFLYNSRFFRYFKKKRFNNYFKNQSHYNFLEIVKKKKLRKKSLKSLKKKFKNLNFIKKNTLKSKILILIIKYFFSHKRGKKRSLNKKKTNKYGLSYLFVSRANKAHNGCRNKKSRRL